MLSELTNKLHHNKGKTTQSFTDREQRIYNFLEDNPVGVLTSTSPHNEPHGSVVYFAVNNDFTINFLTKTETTKYQNIVKNNHVMLVVFEPRSQTVAQVIGVAEEVTDMYEFNGIAQKVFTSSLRTSKNGTLPVSKIMAGGYAAFGIVPSQIRMASYGDPLAHGYDKIFESIESFELN